MRAKEKGKPILVFTKSVPNRTASAQALASLAGVKYATFENVEGLHRAVQDAINQALVSGLRALRETTGGAIIARLRQLAQNRKTVAPVPTIPRIAQNQGFEVLEVGTDTLTLMKVSSEHKIGVPLPRVEQVLFAGESELPIISLDGRLQWITVSQKWVFLPEKPSPDDEFGVGKRASVRDPTLAAVAGGFEVRWFLVSNVPTPGWNVFYHGDGRYLRAHEQGQDFILMCQRP